MSVQLDPSEFLTVKRNLQQSWVYIDKSGQRMMFDLDKYAIMRRVQIHARDIRILDPDLSYPPTIVGRERAIVLNLEHIKVIITAEECFFRGPLASEVVTILEELQRRVGLGAQNDETPFEFRVLELALESVSSTIHARTMQLESIYPVLDKVTSKISTSSLDRIRQMKSELTGWIARVHKVRNELEQLLDDDDDMADLYLSWKLARVLSSIGVSDEPKRHASLKKMGSKIARAKRVDQNDVEELEVLLEKQFMQIDSSLTKLTTLREYIDDTEDYINIQLDNVRNQLIKFELILSCGGICISVYSLVAGILGMNIPFSWNTKEYMFKWVVSVTGTFCALLFVLILLWARHKRLVGSG